MMGNGTSHILIVDDDQLTALALMSALKAEDRNILAVPGGLRALTEIGSRRYNLIFLEIGLIDQSGRALLEEVNRLSPSTSVVVMSADTLDQDMENTIINNDYFFLPKPFEVLQVKSLVKRILADNDRFPP